jgi:hypothetical protein
MPRVIDDSTSRRRHRHAGPGAVARIRVHRGLRRRRPPRAGGRAACRGPGPLRRSAARRLSGARAAASVQVPLPVAGHMAGRTGCGLVRWAMGRLGQGRAVGVLLGRVVPEPLLSRLETLRQRMVAGRRVPAGVLRRRRVTATDVTAMGTAPQMQPPSVRGQTLDTSRSARGNRRIERTCARHRRTSLFRSVSDGPTTATASPPHHNASPQCPATTGSRRVQATWVKCESVGHRTRGRAR